MKRAIKNHIKKIRHSNENTKRWWVIGATTIVMCIIVFLWFMYITATLPQIIEKETLTGETIQIEKKEKTFFGTLNEGMKITFNNFLNSFSLIGTRFSKEMEGAIQKATIQKTPPETPFIPNDPEPLESIPLP